MFYSVLCMCRGALGHLGGIILVLCVSVIIMSDKILLKREVILHTLTNRFYLAHLLSRLQIFSLKKAHERTMPASYRLIKS